MGRLAAIEAEKWWLRASGGTWLTIIKLKALRGGHVPKLDRGDCRAH